MDIGWRTYWDNFWKGFDEDPEKIEDVQGIVFRDKRGEWYTTVVLPNDVRPVRSRIYFDPWTGEELE